GIRIDHARRDDKITTRIGWKGRALSNASRSRIPKAIPEQEEHVHVRRARNTDRDSGRKCSPIPSDVRYRLVQRLSLNQPAPLHVVEEESLVFLRPKINQTANVEPEGVEAKFSNFVRSRIEVVARVENVVAQELPCAGMHCPKTTFD